MYERFTDRARRVMAFAQQEAQLINHEYIGTEHVLLGLIKEGSGVAANVLRNLGLNLQDARTRVCKLVKPGPEMVIMGKLPLTPQTKVLMGKAVEAARELNHNYIGTEHILLGILRISPEAVAPTVLREMGMTETMVKEEVVNLLGVTPEQSAGLKPISDADAVYTLMIRGHKGQKRSNGVDYYTHPVAVRDLLVRCGIKDSVVLNTALLHDLLEDTSITEDEIRKVAGEDVLVSVKQLTNLPDQSIPPSQRKWDFATKHANMLKHAKEYNDISKRVKLADRYNNLCDAIWDWEPSRVKRYARAGIELLDAMQPLPVDIESLEREARRFFSCLV